MPRKNARAKTTKNSGAKPRKSEAGFMPAISESKIITKAITARAIMFLVSLPGKNARRESVSKNSNFQPASKR
jgi:hypothetical protein